MGTSDTEADMAAENKLGLTLLLVGGGGGGVWLLPGNAFVQLHMQCMHEGQPRLYHGRYWVRFTTSFGCFQLQPHTEVNSVCNRNG
jgi:hypothetical protein